MRGPIGGRNPTEIDLANSKVGVSLGTDLKMEHEIGPACVGAIKNGELVLVKEPRSEEREQEKKNNEQPINEEKKEEMANENGEGSAAKRAQMRGNPKDEQVKEPHEKSEEQ
jgi:hypothetical protein